MNILKLLSQLNTLKNEYVTFKYNPKKTRKANERRFDRMRAIRYEVLELQDVLFEQYGDHIPYNQLNLMVPCAGPWALQDTHDFQYHGNYLSFRFNDETPRYVGEFNILDDMCGIDNLDVIIKHNIIKHPVRES
jgi:hypothetical protein